MEMFAKGKLSVEQSETCGLRSCFALRTPHPSAYILRFAPWQVCFANVAAATFPHWGRQKFSDCHICGGRAITASGGFFDEPIGSACGMPQGGRCKPPARPVVMTLFDTSRQSRVPFPRSFPAQPCAFGNFYHFSCQNFVNYFSPKHIAIFYHLW